MKKVDFVIFEGSVEPQSEAEEMVKDVRQAVVLHHLEQSLELEGLERKILFTGDKRLISRAQGLGVQIIKSEGDFHFGRAFKSLINEQGVQKIFYAGGGACPMLSGGLISIILRELAETENILYANNFFSCDFVGFTPAGAINRIEPPSSDNSLAYLLVDRAGLTRASMEPSSETLLDIDTPSDVMVLALLPDVPQGIKKTINKYNLPLERLQKVKSIFNDMDKELFVFGRVNSTLFSFLDENLLCRLRIFSEERGMKSRGRIEKGMVSSFFARAFEEWGPQKVFSCLGEICHGAVIDSRVIFAHLKKNFSASDRFNSDLGKPEYIKDPWLREFTITALEAPIPVVLGGHSMILGGLWAMAEYWF